MAIATQLALQANKTVAVPKYSRDHCCCVIPGTWLMSEEIELHSPLWMRVCSPFAESICVAIAILISARSLIVGCLVDWFLRNVGPR